ncbi:hypothetical protein HYE67_008466 [Fusarium culmorum]|uniref:Uncharacterized protein n=1 Tax=Fusarium culmorum TaxID=5516 RepID=A0A7S8HZ59_FUSCU|nr:hypothetical protein HYE67_008466 [Fusarium culmorum]
MAVKTEAKVKVMADDEATRRFMMIQGRVARPLPNIPRYRQKNDELIGRQVETWKTFSLIKQRIAVPGATPDYHLWLRNQPQWREETTVPRFNAYWETKQPVPPYLKDGHGSGGTDTGGCAGTLSEFHHVHLTGSNAWQVR